MQCEKKQTGILPTFMRVALMLVIVTGVTVSNCCAKLNITSNIATYKGQLNAKYGKGDKFLIGIFWPPVWEQTNEQQYKVIKEAHVDFVQNVQGDLLDTKERNLKMLQLAKENGLKIVVADSRINGSESEVKAMVHDYETDANIGYHIADEPGIDGLTGVSNTCRKVLVQDNKRILFVNLLPEWAVPNYESDYVAKWIEKAGKGNIKYLSFDNYPFFKNGTFRDSYFKNLNIIRQSGLKNGIRTASYLQSIGIAEVYRRPNAVEMGYCAFINLAYGVKNVIWFTYWTPTNRGEVFTNSIIDPNGNKTDLYEPFKKINGEIQQLGKRLIRLDAVEVYHSGSKLTDGVERIPDTFFWQPENGSDEFIVSHLKGIRPGEEYVMVVNKSITQKSKFVFHVRKSFSQVFEVSKDTGKNMKTNFDLKTGSLSGEFLPGEGKLYQLKK